jgi:hypothetical protein
MLGGILPFSPKKDFVIKIKVDCLRLAVQHMQEGKMTKTIEDLNQSGATNAIANTLGHVLWGLLEAYDVEFEDAKVTGIEIVQQPDEEGVGPQRQRWCCHRDAQGNLVCNPC